MCSIFLSYRQADSPYIIGRIYDNHLDEAVFVHCFPLETAPTDPASVGTMIESYYIPTTRYCEIAPDCSPPTPRRWRQ